MKNIITFIIITISSIMLHIITSPEAEADEKKDTINWEASTNSIKNSIIKNNTKKASPTKKSDKQITASIGTDEFAELTTGTMDEAVSELLEIISDIAIKKVKNDTANVLIARIRDVFNKVEIKIKGKDKKLREIFTRTAAIVDSLSYSNLAVVGTSIKKALIEDSIELIKNQLSENNRGIAIYLYYSIINGEFNDINSQRVLEVINQLIQLKDNAVEAKLAKAEQAKTEAEQTKAEAKVKQAKAEVEQAKAEVKEFAKVKLVAHCLCLYYNQKNNNIYKIVNSIFNISIKEKNKLQTVDKNALDVLIKYKDASKLNEAQLIELLDKGVIAISSSNLKNKQRIKVILDFYVSLFTGAENQTGVNKDIIVSMRNIIYAQLDNDNSKLVVESFELVKKLINDDKAQFNKKIKSIIPLLSAITAYAETYTNVSNNSDSSATSTKKDIDNKKKIREQIVENLMTETTNRAGRYDEWITSLGVNFGANVYGWYHYVDKKGTEKYRPQLSLPLGLYHQWMPVETRIYGLNWHFGIFIFDLGQYINYDNDGNTTKPEWNTAFTVGLQIGLIVGTPEMSVNFGFDARYIPAASIQVSEEDGKDKKGGYRIGFYAATYVPFFDFN